MNEDSREITPIDSNTVLEGAGPTKVEASFIQKAGLWLAGGVGFSIVAITGILAAGIVYYYPSPLTTEVLEKASDPRALIEQHKMLTEITVKNFVELFQSIVVQAFLPVFTAILGYLFAKSSQES